MSYTEQIQIHKTNKLAGLYPTTKLWIVLLFTICTFVIDSVPFTQYDLPLLSLPWFLVVIILCVASGEMKKCLKAFKAVFTVAFVIFVVQTFIVPGEAIVWQWKFLSIHAQGLRTAISLSLMVMNIAGIFVWVFQTTSNKEISRALEESGMNHKVAYTFSSTLQMIDILGDNSKTIMNAQKARGIETEGNLLVRSQAFLPSLIPLILGAIIGSEERVLTLEARGFSMQGNKTHLFNLEKSGIEKPALVISVIITVLVVGGRIALIWIR